MIEQFLFLSYLTALSDLVPNITVLMESVSIQDRYMAYLTCALEENCLSSSAYTIKERHPRSTYYIYMLPFIYFLYILTFIL